jgi:hypothetical protein
MSPVRSGKCMAAAMLSLSALAGVAGMAGCGGSSPKPARPIAELPPKQILAKALAAARSAGSVHFDVQATVSSVTVDVAGDARPTAGRQVATSSNGAVMTELVLPGSAYIHGNAAALTGFLDLRAKRAARLANRWFVMHPGDPNYQQITEQVTAESVLSSVIPLAPLVKAKKVQKISGESVIGVVGKAPDTSDLPAGTDDELWVAATGKPLPVAALQVSGSDKLEVFFTRSSWGKKVTDLTAPAGAVPYPGG